MGRNVLDYWELSLGERKAEGLPLVCAQVVYEAIHEWFNNRPMMQPLYVQDLLASNDGNYRPLQSQFQQGYNAKSELDIDDPMDFPPPHHVQRTKESTPP